MTAPFEADAQLAYLNKIQYIDAIVTEDSDLLLFGGKKIIFKMGADYIGKEMNHQDIFEVIMVSERLEI